jgi:long-chain acyl-CoA synthetase
MPERCYLLTGASGFLGRALLCEIARREPEARIYATVRAPVGDLDRRVAALGWRSVAPRTVAVCGDLTRLRAGLSPRDVERITGEVTHVVHAGASVRFDDDLHRARQVNVHGTRQLLELAQRAKRLERFVLVSTAFVGGDRAGVLLEGPAPPGRFRNTYERTKFEAEELARRAMATLPVTIVRPSIVCPSLGDGDGPPRHRTTERPLNGAPCNALDRRARDDEPRARFLMLLRLYLTHGWRWVPGAPWSIVDMVPADLVARATLALAERPLSDGRWYHLAAGTRAATLREVGDIASRTFRVPPLAFAPPRLFRAALRLLVWSRARPLLERAAPYVPYLSVRTRIDTTDSHRVLRELGVELPRVVEVFTDLLAMLRAHGELGAATEGTEGTRAAPVARPPVRFNAGRGGAAPLPRPAERRS